MIKINNQELESETKGISIRFPREFHNKLKSEAARHGMTKDELFKQLIIEGCKSYEFK